MSIPIISFIEQYGYLAVFVGAVFEGETVALLGGLSAHNGFLSFPLTILTAMFGAIIGDWMFFFLGRYKSESLLNHFPYLRRLIKNPTYYIEKNPKAISFGMRFMYGFRHVVPLSLGASKIQTPLFLFWNALGAFVWALVFVTGGFLIADVLQAVLGDIKRNEFKIIVIAILTFVLFNFIIRLIRTLIRERKNKKFPL